MKLTFDRSVPPPDPWLKAVLVAIGAVALLAARFVPFHALPTMCGFKLLTTWPCLACGMTRSWIHLAHGHPVAAVLQNPVGTLLAVTTAILVVYAALRSFTSMPAIRVRMSRREVWALRGLAIAGITSNWLYVSLSGVA